MYNLSHFKADDPADVEAFMRAHPFALLCGARTGGMPAATQVPVLFERRDGKLFLQAHVMRKQDHTIAFAENPNVLAVFSGAHAYVSASWYTDPKVASTWNYRAVHAQGVLRFIEDEAFLHGLLARLTAAFERPDSPASFERLDPGYVSKAAAAIVGFEIEITSIGHVFKLSQNRDETSQRSIVEHLEAQGGESAAVAEAMKARKSR